MMLKHWLAAAIGLAAAGCAQQAGPVLGEWRSEQPGAGVVDSHKMVDLVLGGGPGAQSGTYYMSSTEENPNQSTNHDENRWSGAWTSTMRAVDGRPVMFITLHDHLPNEIGGYSLNPDGRLHALNPDGSPNNTQLGSLYTLSPVPARAARP